jgi:hypothetical protein
LVTRRPDWHLTQGQIGPMPATKREATISAALAHAATKYRIMVGPSFRLD